MTKTLHMVSNAHIDPVWLWQWQEGFHEVKATFRSVLDRMAECEHFVFVSSSAAFYEWIEKSDPQMFEEIKRRVAEGRWQIVGGWWVEPDCNIPSGESFVRQGLLGQRYFKEKLGVTAIVGYNVDSFGHHGALPQILRKSGMKYYVFMRPGPQEKELPSRLFWWESDDGSRVLVYRIPHQYATWGNDLEAHIRRCAAELDCCDEMMCFYGVGNHGGGPTKENLKSIHRLSENPALPTLLFSSPNVFFESVHARDLPIPVVHDDLQHHASGCYAANSGVKRWNRRAENLLVTAEKWSVLAHWIVGQPYPDDLVQAWKDVLLNQFHDILAGTSLEVAYKDARDMYGEAMSIAGRGLNLAIQAFAWNTRIEREDGMRPIIVFNPHAWASRACVELEFGGLSESDVLLDDVGCRVRMQTVQSWASAPERNRLSFVADLPAMGYRVYRLAPRPSAADISPLQSTQNAIETGRFRVEIDPHTGCIKSLYDKAKRLEVFLGQAAVPVVIDDPSDTWGHGVFRFDHVVGAFTAISVALVEHGPVMSAIRVESRYADSRLIQVFAVYQDLDWIDVQVTVDWREQLKMLKLKFPVNLSSAKATYEIPYGHIERPVDGDEEPGQGWIDLSGMAPDNGGLYGLSILNDSKYSFDIRNTEMSLTVLRSPAYGHHVPVDLRPGGPYSFVDQGIQRFRYALLPHGGSWEQAGVVRRAAELNQPPITLIGTYHEQGFLPQRHSFVSVDRDNIVVTCIKKAEDNDDMILRCYEAHQVATRATIRLPGWNPGDARASPGPERAIEAQFGPCEIKTFRIPKDDQAPVIETNLLEWKE